MLGRERLVWFTSHRQLGCPRFVMRSSEMVVASLSPSKTAFGAVKAMSPSSNTSLEVRDLRINLSSLELRHPTHER